MFKQNSGDITVIIDTLSAGFIAISFSVVPFINEFKARTYNPNHNFNYNRFNNCLNNINNQEIREAFSNKKVLLTTRQPKKFKENVSYSKI